MDNPIIERQEDEDNRNFDFWDWVDENSDALNLEYQEYKKNEKVKVKTFEEWVDWNY
jgi:hypothetical protein